MLRYKYIVKAYNQDKIDVFGVVDVFDVDIVEATVFAVSETLAIAKAKELMSRQNYAILKVEMIEC